MATLVLGAAGALVGSFFGPLGTSIGWSLGAALGGALFPGKGQNGPRLTDLKLQNSSYGQMIPITYGTVRIAGNVHWSTDLQEHEHKSGGKGGAPESTNYTYSASFAILLCEGPIGGVSRIWADSRLVWDQDTSDTDAFPFTLYLGDATQLPDPTMEGIEGVGNVPAYRHRAYIVFDDIDLTNFGNRIPSLTFEIFHAGGPIPWRVSTFIPYGRLARAGFGGFGPLGAVLEDGKLLLGFVDGSTSLSSVPVSGTTYTIESFDLEGNSLGNILTTTLNCPDPGPSTWTPIICANNPHILWGNAANSPHTDCVWMYDGAVVANPVNDPFSNPHNSYALNGIASFSAVNQAVYCTGGLGPAYLARWDAPGGVPVAIPSAVYGLPGVSAGSHWITVTDDTGGVWCANTSPGVGEDQLVYLDADLNLSHAWTAAQLPPDMLWGSVVFTVWDGYLFFNTNGLPLAAYKIDFNTWLFTLTDPGTVDLGVGGDPGNLISLGNGLAIGSDGIFSLVGQPEAAILGDIVADISVRCGLTTDQFDRTQLPDPVDGYIITSQMDGRSAIEPLQVAWPFDAREHDVIVEFVRRGVNPVAATIPEADLGAYAYPGEPPAAMVTTRVQEVDLPKVIDVVFLNEDTDYQNGQQRSQRLLTNSQLTTTIQLPIVMTNVKARQVTDIILYDAWTEREKFAIQLARNWLLLEPADVVNARNRLMRITKKNDGADGVSKLDAVATNLQVYMQASLPAPGVGMPGSGGVPPTTPPSSQLTDLLMLDLPLIVDTDYPNGYYAAMAGAVRRSWAGATLYKSLDGGTTYNSLLVDATPDTFGTASTVLGDFTAGNVFDESNSVTVVLSLGSGELASESRLAVLNGANEAVLGSEVFQYRNAVLTGTRTYELSGLLRGRRGTEWAIGTHGASERFVVLPTSINVNGPAGELNLAREFKAVTSANALSGAAVVAFTNTGIATKPYAPVHLGGGRDASGNLTLTWVRRTRIGGAWLDYAEVPLSEGTETYKVNIYSDGTYGTLLASYSGAFAGSLLYSAGAQTGDFGSPQSTVYWGVQQLGMFFYGYEARGAT